MQYDTTLNIRMLIQNIYVPVLQHKQNMRRGLNAIKVHGVAVGTRRGGTPSSPHADALGDQASVGYAHA